VYPGIKTTELDELSAQTGTQLVDGSVGFLTPAANMLFEHSYSNLWRTGFAEAKRS